MKNHQVSSWLATGFLGSLALGCTTEQHMKVPADVASKSEVLQATDRSAISGSFANEDFKLGAFEIKDVDRDWDSGSGFNVGSLSSSTTEGGYEYKFEGKGKKEVGHCATEKKDTGLGLGSGFALEFEFKKLGCTCDGSHKQASVIVEASQRDYKGVLTTSKASYQVKSIHSLEGSLDQSKPTGFRIDGESALGAAETTHPGRIWLDKGMPEDERTEVACLFVGLMLYKPKEDK